MSLFDDVDHGSETADGEEDEGDGEKPNYFVDPADGALAEAIKPHSNDKHLIVRWYVDICRGVRGKWIDAGCTATYLDLYCGPGRACDRDGTNFRDASPLIAWEMSRTPPKGAPRCFTQMVVADKAPELVAALEARMRARGAPVQPFIGDAERTVIKVVARLASGFHFALLDPYGIKQLPFTIIETLAAVRNLDLLIHVSATGLRRNLGLNVRGDHANFDRFAPGWRAVYNPRATEAVNVHAIFEHWARSIAALGKSAKGTAAIESNGRTLYWLVLVSAHPRAGEFWEKISRLRAQRPLQLT